MRVLRVAILLVAFALPAKADWQRIGAGSEFKQAEAYCRIWARQNSHRSVFAMGDPSYVGGVQLGNAIGNLIRRDQNFNDCMTLQGWESVPTKRASKKQRTNFNHPQ